LEFSLSPVWSARLGQACTAALALLAVWLLVRVLWLVLGGAEVAPRPLPPIPSMPSATTAEAEFNWPLFGTGPLVRPAPTIPTSQRPDLRLKGLVSGPGGFAILADRQGQDGVFRVDDQLPDGSRLMAIEAQRIVIRRNGQDEALAIDDQRSAGAPRPAAPGEPARVARPNIPGIRGYRAPAGISTASLPTSAAGRFDASQLAGLISVMPVTDGGFRVRPGRDARLFAELGLRINDVVVAVNGQPLQSEDDARALFSDVLSRGEVAITVRRQGREMTLRPDLEAVIRSLQNP